MTAPTPAELDADAVQMLADLEPLSPAERGLVEATARGAQGICLEASSDYARGIRYGLTMMAVVEIRRARNRRQVA